MKPVCLDMRGMQPGFKAHFGRGLGRLCECLALNLPEAAGDLPLAGMILAGLPEPDPAGLPGSPRLVMPEPLSGMKGLGNILNEEYLGPRGLRDQVSLIHYIAHLDAPGFPTLPTVVTVPDLIMARFGVNLADFPWRLRTRIRVKRWLEHRAALKARRVIAISEYTGMEVVKYFGVSPDRVRVTPLAADERFRPVDDPDELRRVKDKYGLPEKFFLTVGGFDPRKNLPALIRAFGRLIKSGRDRGVCLLMAGSTKDAGQVAPVQEAIFKETPALRAGFLGFVADEDLPALYCLATALVFPSLYEGFGLPVLEAMSCGCPTITAKATSLPEVAGEATLYFDPEDEDDMTRAMAEFLNTDGLAERLIEQGLERAKLFTWKRTAQLTVEVYREVLEEIGELK